MTSTRYLLLVLESRQKCMFLQVIELGEFGMLQLNANGAVIGRARRSDEVDRVWSTVRQRSSDHLDADVRCTTANVASLATLRTIPSIGDQRHASNNDSASRDYFGLKQEIIMTSSGRAGGDAFNREQRQRRSVTDLPLPVDLSRDTHRVPAHRDAAAWRQPEAVKADDGASSRRPRPRSSVNVSSADLKEIRRQTEYQRQANRDAVNAGREDHGPRQLGLANNCSHKELHHRKRTSDNNRADHHIRTSVNVDDSVVDFDRAAAAVDVPQTERQVTKTGATSVGEQRRVSEGRRMMVTSSTIPLADRSFTSSQPEIRYAAPPSAATYKSAAAVVAKSNQIWWPYHESSDEEDVIDDKRYSSSTDKDRSANKDVDAAAADDSDADNDVRTKVAPWTEISASFEESIRELDIFLQQQDSDSL